MKRPNSRVGLQLLIVLGVAIACAGVVLHLALPAKYERVEIIPIMVGFALALFGAYWMDPDRAKRAADGVTHAGAEVVHSYTELRTGRRKEDPVITVEKTTPAGNPEATPAVKVTVTQEGGAPGPIMPAPDTPPTGGFEPPAAGAS
jgi:hypothetical protein